MGNKYLSIFLICLPINFILILLILHFPLIFNQFIKMNLIIRPGSDILEKWSNINIPIYLKVYFFDVQNADKIEFEKEKPILIEKGPFTFLEKRSKKINKYEKQGEIIIYNDMKKYFFLPNLSKGDFNDNITVPNIPLLILGYKAYTDESSDAELMNEVIASLINRVDAPMFENHTVNEMLFRGYKVKLFEELNLIMQTFNMNIPNQIKEAMFSIFYKKNNSISENWSIQTGIGKSQAFFISSWNNSKYLNYWKTEECNKIKGTDGSLFYSNVNKNDILYVFEPSFCKNVKLVYYKNTKFKNLNTFRFKMSKDVFASIKTQPKNDCYCIRNKNFSDMCEKNGVFDLGGCSDGAPLFLSNPHFLEADYTLLTAIHGLKPVKNQHETYLDVEPITGTVVKAVKRIQFNIQIKENKKIPGFSDVQSMLLPIAWIEESAAIDDEMINKINKLTNIKFKIEFGIVFLIILTTILSFINLVYYISYKSKQLKIIHN